MWTDAQLRIVGRKSGQAGRGGAMVALVQEGCVWVVHMETAVSSDGFTQVRGLTNDRIQAPRRSFGTGTLHNLHLSRAAGA